MNKKQIKHLERVLEESVTRIAFKYEKGAKEHNSNLIDMSNEDLLNNAIDEAIDQLVYLLTLKEKYVRISSL